MIEQAVARYFAVLLLIIGLSILFFALSDRIWIFGIILIAVSGGVGIPLWKWHFDAAADAREAARLKPQAIPERDKGDIPF